MKELISVVVSCYNEEEVLPIFYKEIDNVSKKMDNVIFELLFVDDGSKDKTLSIIKELAKNDSRVKYISFSRNFGKEAAMNAGLTYAKGDYVAVMDADLQDPPKYLYDMYNYLQEEYDVVATRRVTRTGEPKVRSIFSKMWYKLINKMSDTEMVDGARDFRLMRRNVVNAILSLNEYNRYSKGIFSFVGFKTKWIEYENVNRAAGKTKWSFWGLCKYAIDGMTSFSTTPLILSSIFGLIFCFIAVIAIIFVIIRTLIYGDPVGGWPSLVCIILLVSGVQLLCIGIIGRYLSKVYLETKRRPIYIVRETNQK